MTNAQKPKPRWLTETLGLIGPLVLGLAIATLVRTLAFQPFTIPSSSMSPGLLTGDYILVSKFPYGWSRASLPMGRPQGTERLWGRAPQPGEVVVFRLPRDPSQIWIKRVIGLPGDRIEVRRGQIILNGHPLPRSAPVARLDADQPNRPVLAQIEQQVTGRAYVTYDGGPDQAGDTMSPIMVPQGHYFMMGDNRDNSLDSRWSADVGVGLLPASHIVGRAEAIAWSWKPGASLFKPWTWASLRSDRFFRPLDRPASQPDTRQN
jgi:signal peptidase I